MMPQFSDEGIKENKEFIPVSYTHLDVYKRQEYRQDRPVISINDGQDWTLPEVPAADYSCLLYTSFIKYNAKLLAR